MAKTCSLVFSQIIKKTVMVVEGEDQFGLPPRPVQAMTNRVWFVHVHASRLLWAAIELSVEHSFVH